MNAKLESTLEMTQLIEGKGNSSISNGLIKLRLLHLRECAQMWAESNSIEDFIAECNVMGLDFRCQNPVNEKLFGKKYVDKFWPKYLKSLGPRNSAMPVSESNVYYFWYEGISPYYNPADSSMMTQPFINNKIIINIPRKQNDNYLIDGCVNRGEEYLSGYDQTVALSEWAELNYSFFKIKDNNDINFINDEGVESMGALRLSEKEFEMDTNLFISHVGRYSVYFSKAYRDSAVYRNKSNDQTVQLIPQILSENGTNKSFNLDNNSSSYFFSLAAGLRNLLTVAWCDDNIWNQIITNKNDIDSHQPGQTVKLMNDILGTKFPLYFDLILVEDEHAYFIKDDKARGKWYWLYDESSIKSFNDYSGFKANTLYNYSKFPLQTVDYAIPVPPENESMAPIALMNYDIDDEGFPFSC